MQAFKNVMSDLGLTDEKPAESSKAGTGSHDKTAAEEVKEKAATYEASQERTPSREISTNPEEAHAQPSPPSLTSRNTGGTTTTDGADDNASMLPLGKGRPLDTPLNESRNFTPTSNTTGEDNIAAGSSGLTRSPSVVIAPSREEIDAAKSALIMAVASCPVDREVSFSDVDNGDDTGRLEVRQVLKGYKGIDAAIREMNRDAKIKVLNANAMSKAEAKEALGLKDAGEGNATFAKAGTSMPAHSDGITRSTPPSGNTGVLAAAAPIGAESAQPVSDKAAETTAPTAAADANKDRRSSTFVPTSSGRPSIDRLNTIQREELEKIPNAADARPAESENTIASAPVVAAAAPVAASSTGQEVSATTAQETAISKPTTTYGGASLASKLRAEIEERARATKEGRAMRDPAVGSSVEPSVAAKSTSTPVTSGMSTSHASSAPAAAGITDKEAGMVAALPAIEKREKKEHAAEPASASATPVVTAPSAGHESAAPAGITDREAGMVAALPAIEKAEEAEHDKATPAVTTDLTPEPASTSTAATETTPKAADHEKADKAAPTMMTDLTPEPVQSSTPTSTSDVTETSKPSAFTEEFEKPAPATTPAEGTAPVVQTSDTELPAVAVIPSSNAIAAAKEQRVSYADKDGSKRLSKDQKPGGGFLSGLFRRRSSKSASPSKSNGVQSKTVSEPVKPTPVAEKTEEEESAPAAPTETSSAAVVEESPLEKTRTKDTTGTATVTKDTTPKEAKEMAEAAVAGDVPVIEHEVATADPKEAPSTTATEDGGKAASILEDLEGGPKETVAEPGHGEDSREIAAVDADEPVEEEGTASEEPVTTGEPLSKQETKATFGATPAAAASSATTSPVQTSTPEKKEKKKNRFSSLFARRSKDPSTSSYTYRPVSDGQPVSEKPASPTTREAEEEPEAESAEVADTSAVTADTVHTTSRPASLDDDDRVDTEPEDEVEPEPEVPDNRSITEIAATTPLPEPAYTEKTKAKHEKLRKKQEYEDMVRKEKARREAELLYKRDRIMNAYTGKQDFSKVPKAAKTKNFGRSIHTGGVGAEGADPIQHIVKSDKKAYKAEEADETLSRGSSIHDDHEAKAEEKEDAVPPTLVASGLMDRSATNGTTATASKQKPVGSLAELNRHTSYTVAKESAPEAEAPASPSATSPSSPTTAGVKKRKSVRKSVPTEGTSQHRRKSSADAGLSPLTTVTAPAPASADAASPTLAESPRTPKSPTTELTKRASIRSSKSAKSPGSTHRREKSGESVPEDHTLHLTGATTETGLISKASIKSNKTPKRKIVDPSSGVAV